MVSVCHSVGNMGQSDRVTVAVVKADAVYQQFNDVNQTVRAPASGPSPLHDVRVLHHGLNRAIRSGCTHTVFSYARRLVGAYASLPCQ